MEIEVGAGKIRAMFFCPLCKKDHWKTLPEAMVREIERATQMRMGPNRLVPLSCPNCVKVQK